MKKKLQQKSGGRPGAIGSSQICERAEREAATCLYTDEGFPIRAGLSAQDAW